MVRLAGVERSFGPVEAVRRIDLEIPARRCVGIVGHNGSGKSTLLQMIAGRLRPSVGAVEVDGVDLSTPAGLEHVRRFAAVGGAVAAFYPDLTVGEHLELVAIAHGVEDIARRVDDLLARLELAERRDALPGQLSTGMRQKLDLALAFVRPSQLLILDEPDRGLDPAARQRVWDDVRRYRATGRTAVVALHQLEGLDELFDEVLLLESGALRARGTLTEVRDTAAAGRLGLTG